MEVLFLILYAGFCAALSRIPQAATDAGIPTWTGGNYTPHGALLNHFEGRWTIAVFWGAVLTGVILVGRIMDLPGLEGIALGLTLVLWIAGLAALGHRLARPREVAPAARDDSVLASFHRFRILIREPEATGQGTHIPALAALCISAEAAGGIRDTPYTFLKELSREGLKAALKLVPGLPYQPVQPEISEQTDEHIATLQQEVHSHVDKALAAQAGQVRAEQRATLLEERTILLENSEKQAREDLERIRTRSRTAVAAKPIEQMSDGELDEHYRSLMAETRKVNLLRQNRAGGAIRQASLPMINP